MSKQQAEGIIATLSACCCLLCFFCVLCTDQDIAGTIAGVVGFLLSCALALIDNQK
jgi:hypothetical protein